MFDIGFFEIVVIAIVTLIVVGPEKMPHVVKVTGLWIGKATASIQAVRNDISKELQADELRQTISQPLPKPDEVIERYVFPENSETLEKKHVEAEPIDENNIAINDDPMPVNNTSDPSNKSSS